MSQKARPARDYPFYVVLAGKSDEDGAMKGFESESDAIADCSERNHRAKSLGIKAEYRVKRKD